MDFGLGTPRETSGCRRSCAGDRRTVKTPDASAGRGQGRRAALAAAAGVLPSGDWYDANDVLKCRDADRPCLLRRRAREASRRFPSC